MNEYRRSGGVVAARMMEETQINRVNIPKVLFLEMNENTLIREPMEKINSGLDAMELNEEISIAIG